MKLKLIDFIFGSSLVSATGVFPERILNISKEEGIFIQNVNATENGLTFHLSRKGARRLFTLPLPPDINISVTESYGLPAMLESGKSRLILLFSPFVIFALLFFSTQIIWNVNIINATPEIEKHLLSELEKHGVKRGAVKASISQSDVQNKILIDNPDLMWIWVDIRGATALVNYASRTILPPAFDENTFYNLYSTRDAVIEYISATNGVEKVKVGDTVFKGQLLIEGSIASGPEERRNIHASGTVIGTAWEERIVRIPKKREIRTPTGQKTELLSVNFKNFHLKLYINSSILYQNYDIIESNRSLPLIPVIFNKTEYREVKVSYHDNDIARLQSYYEKEFSDYLTAQGFTINYTESDLNDTGDEVVLTMRALCREPIAQERRMNIGEDNTITDN